MIIKNEKVLLRAIEENDLELLQKIVNSSEVEYYLTGHSLPVSKKNQKDWYDSLGKNNSVIRMIIESQGKAWGIVILSKIDYINRSANFGIKTLLDEDQPKGIGTESGKLILEYAFKTLNLRRIETEVLEYNIRSKKMLEKIGFRLEGIKKEAVFKNGKYIDLEIMATFREEL